MTKEQIGSILKQLRIENGKTQKEVAEILGRKQQIVGHWETGYAQPDANTLFTLCEIYGTTVDAAFGFKRKGIDITKEDLELIRKYHTLDEHGKKNLNDILDNEYSRCNIRKCKGQLSLFDDLTPNAVIHDAILADSTTKSIPIAAHNNHDGEPGEIEKMQRDASNLKRPE